MGWLWLLSEEGVPFRIPDTLKPENSSDISWSAEPVKVDEEELQIRQIASCSKSTFALDSNGTVHVFLHPAVLLVRRSFEVYENQRWYPILRWHYPLPTDWPRISTEDGQRASFDSEALPSTGWRWEESREVQKGADCDKEGWQYSQLFSRSAKWTKSQGITSLVRRRRWKRSMRYVAVAKWIPIPDSGQCFVTISAGCSSVTKQGCLLFAVGIDGCLYKRTVTNDKPEGDQWSYVDGITNNAGDREDIVLLACSPINPFLLAVTWEGKLYSRAGISSTNLIGTDWQSLQTPLGKPITAVSIGNEAVWVATADGQLYYHHIDVTAAKSSRNFLYLHEQSYRSLGKGWTSPTVSPFDQLFVIQNGKISFRDGISAEERTGKAFVQLVDRSGQERKWISIATGGFHQDRLPSHWINELMLFNNNDFSYQQAKWRQTILEALISKNEHNWDIFQLKSKDSALTPTESEEGYSKYSKVRVQFPGNLNYYEGYICLSGQKIIVSTGRKTVDEGYDKLLQAEKSCDMCPFKFCLVLIFEWEKTSQSLRVSFPSEKERDSWFEQLQLIIVKSYLISPKEPNNHACWTIGRDGNVRHHPMNELILVEKQNPLPRSFSQLRSIDIPGHFHSISAGNEGIVWALTNTGQPFALSPTWKATEERNLCNFEQSDTVTRTIFEYQRHQFFRGFVSFASAIQGIAPWMGECGPVMEKYSRLPTCEWSWLCDSWKIENVNEDEGWSYALEIKGPYDVDQKRARFRRRKLLRRAKFSAMTPWITVEGPNLKSVVVQKDSDDRVLVFGLTENGDVLLRQGVEKIRPHGYVWKQIVTDSPMSCLALRTPVELWAVASNGKVLLRKCEDQTDMECCDWVEVALKITGTASQILVQTRGWLIINDTLVMMDLEEDGFTVLGEESHKLCRLEEPNGLALMPTGHLAVLEGGELNHHIAWEKKILKQGRRNVRSYECKRITFSTGFSKSCAFN